MDLEIAAKNGWYNNQTPEICSTDVTVDSRWQEKHSLELMASWSVLDSDVTFSFDEQQFGGRAGTIDLRARGEIRKQIVNGTCYFGIKRDDPPNKWFLQVEI